MALNMSSSFSLVKNGPLHSKRLDKMIPNRKGAEQRPWKQSTAKSLAIVMRRRRRRNWPIALVCLGLLALFCVYTLCIPLATLQFGSLRGEATSVLRIPAPPISQQIVFRSFEFLVAAWFFMFGACIGSFLNVVIYRAPRGFSLLGSSRCPYCRSKIRFYDNIPVFAWISLRGRCRDCRLPISPRYPLVEFATGMIFLGLAVPELFLAGRNLPGEYGGMRLSVSWLVHHFPWDLVATYLYHSTLLSILLSWALIKFDRNVLPRFYILLAMAIGLAVPAANPSVHPAPWMPMAPAWLANQPWSSRLDTSIIGLISGLSMGLVSSSLWIVGGGAPRQRPAYLRDTVAIFGVVGLFLGWQAMLSIAGIAACTRLLVVALMARRTGAGPIPAEDPLGRASESTSALAIIFPHVLLATALQIVLWDALARLAWWPGPHCSVLATSAVAIATLMLTLAAEGIQRRTTPSGDIPE